MHIQLQLRLDMLWLGLRRRECQCGANQVLNRKCVSEFLHDPAPHICCDLSRHLQEGLWVDGISSEMLGGRFGYFFFFSAEGPGGCLQQMDFGGGGLNIFFGAEMSTKNVTAGFSYRAGAETPSNFQEML